MSNENIIKSTPQKSPLLTQDIAFKLMGALARLEELKNAPPALSIVKPDGEDADTNSLSRDAETNALVEYVAAGLLAHAGELLGCYYAVQTEYNPLLRVLVPVVRRVNAQIHQLAQQPAPANVASN